MSVREHRFPIRTFGAGLLVTGVGWSWLTLPIPASWRTWAPAVVSAGLLLAGGTALGWAGGRHGSNATIGRWNRQRRRHGGTASWWNILRTSSTWAMRRKATVLRPSLREASRWRRLRTPVKTYASDLCRTGHRRIWTSVEESTLRVGIPGCGKTAELACRVLDAPGGVLVTSTAADLYELTEPVRRSRGPIASFNPGGIGAIASTLRWSPLSGCTDPQTAARRARDLMGPASQSPESERWDAQGRRVLGILLHAAALGEHRVRDIQAWVTNPDVGRKTILAALDLSPQATEMRTVAEHVIALTPRTRDGVMLAIAPALAWVTNPNAAAIGDPENVDAFHPSDLIDRNGTLYLLGDDDGQLAPLVGALTAEIVHTARQIAATRPGGRLDPALTLALDEVALVCPLPLDRWMAELRKRSIVIHAAAQGLGQLRQRWGRDGASIILNTAAAVLCYGGCKDPDDLELFAKLAGERDEPVETRDADGNLTGTTVRRVPVIPAAMLAALPNHRAQLVRRGMPAAIVSTPVVWKRRDLRKAQAADTRAAKAAVAAAAKATRAAAAVPTQPDAASAADAAGQKRGVNQ